MCLHTLRLQSIQLRELAIACDEVLFSTQVSGPTIHRNGSIRKRVRAERVPFRALRWLWIARE